LESHYRSGLQISVELDQDLYFETSKKLKKMVQFYGFDKIWNSLNNMGNIKELSLPDLAISDLGGRGHFRQLLPQLQVLSIEENLLFHWDQVFQVGAELPQLESLSVSANILQPPEEVLGRSDFVYLSSGEPAGLSPVGVFQSLRSLIAVNMRLTWKAVCAVLPVFPVLEELILCKNALSDPENIKFRSTEDL